MISEESMLRDRIHTTVFAVVVALALPAFGEEPPGRGEDGASLVSTFHCIGIYWSPVGGGPEHEVLVRYRRSGQQRWRCWKFARTNRSRSCVQA